jgi:hypothetical protein
MFQGRQAVIAAPPWRANHCLGLAARAALFPSPQELDDLVELVLGRFEPTLQLRDIHGGGRGPAIGIDGLLLGVRISEHDQTIAGLELVVGGGVTFVRDRL